MMRYGHESNSGGAASNTVASEFNFMLKIIFWLIFLILDVWDFNKYSKMKQNNNKLQY
jgi:hypothetical protein